LNVLVATGRDEKLGLWILARSAENKLVDERIEELTKTVRLVKTVHDVSLVGKGGLSAKFAAEKLGRVCEEAHFSTWSDV
jgi:diphthamide synthase (EF-2-diphthine--ammonia ligase)